MKLKSRETNQLQISFERQHFLLSYLKTLSAGRRFEPSKAHTTIPLATREGKKRDPGNEVERCLASFAMISIKRTAKCEPSCRLWVARLKSTRLVLFSWPGLHPLASREGTKRGPGERG